MRSRLYRQLRPTRLEINAAALVHNAGVIRMIVGRQVMIIAVVKADAYGHSATIVGQVLESCAVVDAFAVSLVEEGIQLRKTGLQSRVLVLGGNYDRAHAELHAHALEPVVARPSDVRAFSQVGLRARRRIPIHLKIDSGMSRLGARPEQLEALLAECQRSPGVLVTGCCTHLSSAGLPDVGPTQVQLERFETATAMVQRALAVPLLQHAANSAAITRFPSAHYDAVRPGLALYGGHSLIDGGPCAAPFRPAMRLVTQIAQLRNLDPGDRVGYDGLWQAARPSRIATLPIGYGDGYPRAAMTGGEVLIHGRRCPIVGTVCMDMTMIDVTVIRDQVAIGDEVVLVGDQGGERITTLELAQRTGRIEYEIMCGISKRVPRLLR